MLYKLLKHGLGDSRRDTCGAEQEPVEVGSLLSTATEVAAENMNQTRNLLHQLLALLSLQNHQKPDTFKESS